MNENVLPFRRIEQRALSDETLVLACAAGDGRALEELFHRHGGQVHRVLARLGHVERKDLDDLVQATFLEVHRSARRFTGRSAVTTWILGIAMNVRRHHVRGEARRRSAMAAMTAVARAPAAAAAVRWPDEQASQRELLAHLKIGVDTLPDDVRIVFVLCELEGLKGTDVARTLGVPEGTVWRRLHEARLRLRAYVDAEVAR